jgi:hypothetical protein
MALLRIVLEPSDSAERAIATDKEAAVERGWSRPRVEEQLVVDAVISNKSVLTCVRGPFCSGNRRMCRGAEPLSESLEPHVKRKNNENAEHGGGKHAAKDWRAHVSER